jgi:predicted acetyltransferase
VHGAALAQKLRAGRDRERPVARRPLAEDEFTFALDCRDLVWLEEADARALLAFLSGSRALATDAEWSGPVDEPLTAFFPEEVVTGLSNHSWMCRTLDPSAALRSRGWPPALSAEIDIEVVDPFLGTSDTLHVRVAKGEATVEPASSASLRMSAGTLASLLTGWRAARDAQRTGQFEGATATEVETLEAMFAGPKPWVMDLV